MTKELLDQAGHFLWAAAAVVPVALIGPNLLSGVLTGLALCLPRELIDQWHGWPIGWRKWLDIFCFALGGAISGWLIGALNGN